MNHVQKLLIILTLTAGFYSNTIFGISNKLANEQQMLNAFSKNGRGVIFFYSPNCDHCKKIRPLYEQLVKKYNYIYFGEIDVTINSELFQRYISLYAPLNLPATPYFVLFRGGHPVQGSLPGIPGEDLESFVARA